MSLIRARSSPAPTSAANQPSSILSALWVCNFEGWLGSCSSPNNASFDWLLKYPKQYHNRSAPAAAILISDMAFDARNKQNNSGLNSGAHKNIRCSTYQYQKNLKIPAWRSGCEQHHTLADTIMWQSKKLLAGRNLRGTITLPSQACGCQQLTSDEVWRHDYVAIASLWQRATYQRRDLRARFCYHRKLVAVSNLLSTRFGDITRLWLWATCQRRGLRPRLR